MTDLKCLKFGDIVQDTSVVPDSPYRWGIVIRCRQDKVRLTNGDNLFWTTKYITNLKVVNTMYRRIQNIYNFTKRVLDE